MDVAGARALANRIAEHRARRRGTAEERSSGPQTSAAADVRDVEPETAAARDLRIYTADVRLADVDGRPTPVTVVRCRRVVDGHWETRVVEVDVRRRRDSV
jgi:hypothetical protein